MQIVNRLLDRQLEGRTTRIRDPLPTPTLTENDAKAPRSQAPVCTCVFPGVAARGEKVGKGTIKSVISKGTPARKTFLVCLKTPRRIKPLQMHFCYETKNCHIENTDILSKDK